MPLLRADDTGLASTGKQKNLVVVELFTSQGCASCPPADEVLAMFSQQDGVLALSCGVDYWNYLGWTDQFARAECRGRQKKYNQALGKSGVYTPQMIIQGSYDLVGSHKAQARQIVAQVHRQPSPSAPALFLHRQGDMILLRTGFADRAADTTMATLWLVGYDFKKTVHITSGELAGQTRNYYNVVRSIRQVGRWMGEAITLTLSVDDVGPEPYDAYALLLQSAEMGPVLAAVRTPGLYNAERPNQKNP